MAASSCFRNFLNRFHPVRGSIFIARGGHPCGSITIRACINPGPNRVYGVKLSKATRSHANYTSRSDRKVYHRVQCCKFFHSESSQRVLRRSPLPHQNAPGLDDWRLHLRATANGCEELMASLASSLWRLRLGPSIRSGPVGSAIRQNCLARPPIPNGYPCCHSREVVRQG